MQQALLESQLVFVECMVKPFPRRNSIKGCLGFSAQEELMGNMIMIMRFIFEIEDWLYQNK